MQITHAEHVPAVIYYCTPGLGLPGPCPSGETRIAGGLHVHAARARTGNMHVMWPRADADVTGWPITSSSAAGAEYGRHVREASISPEEKTAAGESRTTLYLYVCRAPARLRPVLLFTLVARTDRKAHTKEPHIWLQHWVFFFFLTTVAARG